MIETITEMQRTRQMLATCPETWIVTALEVHDEEGRFIGRFNDNSIARLVCSLHNNYLAVTNLLVSLWQKRIDQKNMRKEQNDTGE